jgi:hypothetical protein
MYTAIAILLLSLVLTLSNANVSSAEVWICSQPGGGTLFTDMPQTDGSCEKHESVSQLNYAPPRNWANVPPPEAIYEWQTAIQQDPQTVSRVEEQEAVSSEESRGYNPEQTSFWSYDENPVISIYTYTSRFYGVPYFRPKHNRNFAHITPKNHGSPRIWTPFNSTKQTPHFREQSIRSIAPKAQTVPPTGMRSPHSSNSSFRTVAPVGSSHSAPPASPEHFRAHSGEAGVHGAPPQSVGFRQDTKH